MDQRRIAADAGTIAAHRIADTISPIHQFFHMIIMDKVQIRILIQAERLIIGSENIDSIG